MSVAIHKRHAKNETCKKKPRRSPEKKRRPHFQDKYVLVLVNDNWTVWLILCDVYVWLVDDVNFSI